MSNLIDIELLDSNGKPFLVVAGVENPHEEFNSAYKDRYKATSWREHIPVKQIRPIREAKIKEIKSEAAKRILALDSSWTLENHLHKQMNSMMKASKLLRKEQKGTIKPNEKTELDAFDMLGDSIRAVRDASNNIEDKINSLTVVSEVEEYNVVENIIWP